MKKIILVYRWPQGYFYILGVGFRGIWLRKTFKKISRKSGRGVSKNRKKRIRNLKEPGRKNSEEKSAAIKSYQEEKYQDKENFYEKTHKDHMAVIKERLTYNSKLNEQEKDELISFYEEQYRENATWRNQQYNRNTSFLEEIANSAKTPEEKKEAVKKHFQDQKAEGKTRWEKQRFEKEAKKKDLGLKYKGEPGKGKAERGE